MTSNHTMNITQENLSDLNKLATDIDALLSTIEPDFEVELQEKIYSQIRGLAIDMGIHREFLENFSKLREEVKA